MSDTPSFKDEVDALRNLAMGDGSILARIDRIVVAHTSEIEGLRHEYLLRQRSYEDLESEYRDAEAECSSLNIKIDRLNDEISELKRGSARLYVGVWKDGFDEGFAARGRLAVVPND